MKFDRCFYYTNKGDKRADNQDALALPGKAVTGDMDEVAEFIPVPVKRDRWRDYPMLYAVVDGMNDEAGGAVAAKTIAGIFSSAVCAEASAPFVMNLFNRASRSLAKYVEKKKKAQGEQYWLCAEEEQWWWHYKTMGAVVAGVILNPEHGRAAVFNCGDSRVYRWHRGHGDKEPKLVKLSHEHSVVQKMVDHGWITEAQMRLHPRRNQLTAALGADQEITPVHLHTEPVWLCPDDAFLICSDGLWEALTREQIEEVFRTEKPERRLLELLRGVTCDDNVSFIVLRNTDRL